MVVGWWFSGTIKMTYFILRNIATQILGNAQKEESQTEPKPFSSSLSPAQLPQQTARRARALQKFNSADLETRPCIPKDYGRGSFVCVCNSTYCDTVSLTIPSKIANLYPNIPPSSQPDSLLASKTISLSGKSSPALFDHFLSADAAAAAVKQSFDEEIVVQEGGQLGGQPSVVQTPEELDYRGQVQIFTSTKTGSRLHKSIVQFNNDPDQPYRGEHLLSRHDDLMVRAARSADSNVHTNPATTTSRSQKLFRVGDNGRTTSVGKSPKLINSNFLHFFKLYVCLYWMLYPVTVSHNTQLPFYIWQCDNLFYSFEIFQL